MKKQKGGFQKIIGFSMVCCMLTNLAVPVSFAEETKKEPTYVRMDHPLKEENNWDISNELIMPGEAFYTVPKFEVTYDHGYYGQTVTNLYLKHVSLILGEEPRLYDSKLIRNKVDLAGLTADRTNTYNVWTTQTELWKKSLESAEMGEDTQKQLKAFQEGESTENAGYTNNTNTPIVLEQVRTGATEHEGTIYGGEYSSTPMIVGYTTHNSNCTIQFYEPYYTISYKELSEEEQEGMPDRYYVQREKQELILKTPVRAGCHLTGWSGMAFVDEKVEEGRTIFSFDWEHNMIHANLGDETVGLITYMRTDSTRISEEARNAAKLHIESTYGKQYYENRYYKTNKEAYGKYPLQLLKRKRIGAHGEAGPSSHQRVTLQ